MYQCVVHTIYVQDVAGWRSGYSGQYCHLHFSKDMDSNPTWGKVTPFHRTVMGYLALLGSCLGVDVLKTNSCTSLYGRLTNETLNFILTVYRDSNGSYFPIGRATITISRIQNFSVFSRFKNKVWNSNDTQ